MANQPETEPREPNVTEDQQVEGADIDPELIHSASIIASASENESMPDDIEAIIRRGFSADEGELLDRMKDIANSLGLYFGDQPTATWVLIAISQGHGDMDGVDLLSGISDAAARRRVETMLRRLAGLYGDQIGRGLNVATRPPEDWQYVNTSTRFEVEQGQWLVTLELDRFDGKKLSVSGDAVSMIRLVNSLLAAINTIGSLAEDYAAILWDDEELIEFQSEAQAVLQGIGVLDGEATPSGK